MMNPTAGLEERPAHYAPEELAGQWQPVLRSLGRMESGEIGEEIETMKAAISKVSTDFFQDETKNLWNEFSNRLLVDLTRAEGETPSTALSIVRNSIGEAARYLGLPATPNPTSTADPEAIAKLNEQIRLYLPIAKSLASDDPTTAATAAAKFAEATEDSTIREHAETIAAADTLKPQRKSFETLSTKVIAQVRANGLDRVGNAYVVHCPMAGNDKGADWISNVPKVLNPYYGDSMLNCGSVTETLSLEK